MQITLEPPKSKSDSIWDDYVPIIQRGNIYDVYLTDSIEEPAEYNKLINLLVGLDYYNKVHMYINNNGGAVASAFMIRNAMLKCKAHIVGYLSGTVASSASILSLACDDIVVSPFLSHMSHNYFHGVQGTGNQVKDYVDFTDRELKRAFREIYTGFLTEEEILLVTERDKEVWLNELEVTERWKAYQIARTPKEF
jgi:ATP-dependent protease ClpP protease subunit